MNEGMNGGFTTTLSNGVYTSVYEWFVPYTAVVDYDATAASGTWGVSETEEISFRIGGCIEKAWDAWWVGTSDDYSNAGII